MKISALVVLTAIVALAACLTTNKRGDLVPRSGVLCAPVALLWNTGAIWPTILGGMGAPWFINGIKSVMSGAYGNPQQIAQMLVAGFQGLANVQAQMGVKQAAGGVPVQQIAQIGAAAMQGGAAPR